MVFERRECRPIVYFIILQAFWIQNAFPESGPFQATGFKVGEVTSDSAIVWTRLTLRPERNPSNGPKVEIVYQPSDGKVARRDQTVKSVLFPDGVTVRDIRDAVPGVDGDVRVMYSADRDSNRQETPWFPVDPLRDFTRQFTLHDLRPNTEYRLRVESRDIHGQLGLASEGRFRTAPIPEDPAKIVFTVATCFGNDDQDCPEGFKIYQSMAKLNPNFFVHTGDIVYYDALAKTLELARYHWQRMYSWPGTIAFHRQVASYFMKDDHDTWRNDCWPTMESPYMHEFTFRQGQAVFLQQVPMRSKTYRTYRWGKHLQIWLMEGRDFRTANNLPDGPEKTIWGAEQKAWFKRSFAESDATYRIVINPTPLLGPDRPAKRDNHANSGFRHEGAEIRKFLATQKNTIIICGDRHWQYASVDPDVGLYEYSSGPASDSHANGWNQDEYVEGRHRFLRVAGGFLSGTIDFRDSKPVLIMRFHDVDGSVKFEDLR